MIKKANTTDDFFQSFQRLHLPRKLGSEFFYPKEGIPAHIMYDDPRDL